MTASDASDDFQAARDAARLLPTWVLRLWGCEAAARAASGRPTTGELARLLGVRAVLDVRRPSGGPCAWPYCPKWGAVRVGRPVEVGTPEPVWVCVTHEVHAIVRGWRTVGRDDGRRRRERPLAQSLGVPEAISVDPPNPR
jgi:hypothetical protein